MVAVDWDGWFGSLLAFSAETYPPAAETIDVARETAAPTSRARTVSCAV